MRTPPPSPACRNRTRARRRTTRAGRRHDRSGLATLGILDMGSARVLLSHPAGAAARPGLQPPARGLCAADAVRLGHAQHLQPQRPQAGCQRRCGGRAAHTQPSAGLPSACAHADARGGAGRQAQAVAHQVATHPLATRQDGRNRRYRHRRHPGRRLPVQPQGVGQGLPRQVARRHRGCRLDSAGHAAPAVGGRLQVRGRRPQGAAVPGPLPVPRRDPGG